MCCMPKDSEIRRLFRWRVSRTVSYEQAVARLGRHIALSGTDLRVIVCTLLLDLTQSVRVSDQISHVVRGSSSVTCRQQGSCQYQSGFVHEISSCHEYPDTTPMALSFYVESMSGLSRSIKFRSVSEGSPCGRNIYVVKLTDLPARGRTTTSAWLKSSTWVALVRPIP